jgi:hypothetical protein
MTLLSLTRTEGDEHRVIVAALSLDASGDREWPSALMDDRLSDRYSSPHVYSSNRAIPSFWLARMMRADAMRWLVLVVLMPMLSLGALGGLAFLAHGHDDHGMHLHPVNALDRVSLTAADHADHHGHDHATVPSDDSFSDFETSDDLREVPDGVVVAFDDHKQLPTRGIDLSKSLTQIAVFMATVFVLPTSPDVHRHIGSPGGSGRYGPLHLFALTANDRLVRTTQALLI